MKNNPDRNVLDYRSWVSREREATAKPPRLPLALLLCVPGVLSWLMFGMVMGVVTLDVPDWLRQGMGVVFFPMLILALITSASSVALYAKLIFRGIAPWYVTLNWIVNVPGLIFAALAFGGVIR